MHSITNTQRELLRLGSKGAAVVELQRHLFATGLYVGETDGLYGPETALAVKRYQQTKGLVMDGVVGPSTWECLLGRRAQQRVSVTQPKRFSQVERGRRVGRMGRVSHDDGVNLRARPEASGSIKRRLAFNTRVFVSHALAGDWYFVTLMDGSFGYVSQKFVLLTSCDPAASLHKIRKGEGALAIVRRHYKKDAIQWGQDERYYANVLVEANRGVGLRGVYNPSPGGGWDKVQTRENYLIWIPSLAFARSLRGRVRSGSITHEAWEAVKRAAVVVVDYHLGEMAFLAGVLQGVLESLWDLLTGLVDLVELAWNTLESLWSSTLLADLKGFWDLVAALDVRELINAGVKAFLGRWNNPDFFQRWLFRGWLVGYAVAEIVLEVISGGAALLKWAGKAGKFSKILAKFPKVAALTKKAKQFSAPFGKALKRVKKAGSHSLTKAKGKTRSALAKLRPEKLAQARSRRSRLRGALRDAKAKAAQARKVRQKAEKEARLKKLTEADPVDWPRANKLRKLPKLSRKRLRHIIEGDATGGGHGPLSKKLGKSKFNATTNIEEHVVDTCRTGKVRPNMKWGKPKTDGSFRIEKTYSTPVGYAPDGAPVFSIRVVMDDHGNVITAFPLNLTP